MQEKLHQSETVMMKS